MGVGNLILYLNCTLIMSLRWAEGISTRDINNEQFKAPRPESHRTCSQAVQVNKIKSQQPNSSHNHPNEKEKLGNLTIFIFLPSLSFWKCVLCMRDNVLKSILNLKFWGNENQLNLSCLREHYICIILSKSNQIPTGDFMKKVLTATCALRDR